MSADIWSVITAVFLFFALGYIFISLVVYGRLRRVLEDAVVLVFESNWVKDVDYKTFKIEIDRKKTPSAKAFTAARRIIKCARLLHGRWLKRYMQ